MRLFPPPANFGVFVHLLALGILEAYEENTKNNQKLLSGSFGSARGGPAHRETDRSANPAAKGRVFEAGKAHHQETAGRRGIGRSHRA
jgi:hypothetical protein